MFSYDQSKSHFMKFFEFQRARVHYSAAVRVGASGPE
jgi:trans-2-enoyl-CoA reductase